MSRSRLIAGLAGAAALAAVSLIMPFEGERHTAYLDEPGIPSICWGHTTGVRMGDVATHDQCLDLLTKDIAPIDKAYDRLVKVKTTEKFKASWLSFAFNTGTTAFASSTALKRINANRQFEACEQMLRWVCVKTRPGAGVAKGLCATGDRHLRVSAGLHTRRVAERGMCLEGAT